MAGFQNIVLPQVTAPLPIVGRVPPRTRRTVIQAISAPQRPSDTAESSGDSIRLLDLDNAERARLESTDAFTELVALSRNNVQKQSVNRRQKVSREELVRNVGQAPQKGSFRKRLLALQEENLNFRQNPTFEDCFPNSAKQYIPVEHNGTTLQAGPRCSKSHALLSRLHAGFNTLMLASGALQTRELGWRQWPL